MQLTMQLTNQLQATKQWTNQTILYPTNWTINQPINQLIDQSANQLTNETINQLTNHFNQPTNHFNQTINQPSQPINQPNKYWTKQFSNKSNNKPISQSTNQPKNQPTNLLVSQLINAWLLINQPTNQFLKSYCYFLRSSYSWYRLKTFLGHNQSSVSLHAVHVVSRRYSKNSWNKWTN